MNRTVTGSLTGAAVALTLALGPELAVAQTTYYACRVPTVGAIYMLDDAMAACLDASHVKFSWSEGGSVADGSVTTAKLADDAVTSDKIADGTIQAADIAGGAISGNVAGSQVTGFSGSLAINSATAVELLSLALPGSSSGVATLTAHAYVEKATATTGRYEFTLHAATCAGTLVGYSMWRPTTSADGYSADSIVLTGTVSSATSATTIVLCGRKYDVIAPDATVYARGLIAHW